MKTKKCAMVGCNMFAHRDLPLHYKKYCSEHGYAFWDMDISVRDGEDKW